MFKDITLFSISFRIAGRYIILLLVISVVVSIPHADFARYYLISLFSGIIFWSLMVFCCLRVNKNVFDYGAQIHSKKTQNVCLRIILLPMLLLVAINRFVFKLVLSVYEIRGSYF